MLKWDIPIPKDSTPPTLTTTIEQLRRNADLFQWFMAVCLSVIAQAWMTYHSLEKSWMKVFYLVSQRCPLFLLYSASAGYCLMNFGLWYRDGFAWTVRVEQL